MSQRSKIIYTSSVLICLLLLTLASRYFDIMKEHPSFLIIAIILIISVHNIIFKAIKI